VAVGPPAASLAVWCFQPASAPRGTVLVFHGIRDSKWSQVGTGAHLARLGYVAVLVDSRGHGRSSGRHLTYGVRESRDAVQVLDRLKKEGLLALPVGALGFSYGGAVALQLAARDPRVKAVVSVATFSSLRQTMRDYVVYHLPGIGRVLPTDAQMAAGLAEAGRQAAFDPAATDNVAAAGYTSARLLIVHGAEDTKIPPSHARDICAAAGRRCRLLVMPNEDHDSIFGDRQGVVKQEMKAWFSRWLRQP
jgi:alpha-beta hydrolase superfamily lysophospholipase